MNEDLDQIFSRPSPYEELRDAIIAVVRQVEQELMESRVAKVQRALRALSGTDYGSINGYDVARAQDLLEGQDYDSRALAQLSWGQMLILHRYCFLQRSLVGASDSGDEEADAIRTLLP